MIEDVKPVLIFINETWLHADIKKRRSNASANRSERTEQNAEGRLHNVCKVGLVLREENIVGSEYTESVWATPLSGNGSKTTVGLCYVPPNDRESDIKRTASIVKCARTTSSV